MPAARLGLHYYKSGIRRYVSRLGVDNAKRLFLTAEKIGAAEMLRIGYLTAMVPPEALDEEVDRLAAVLAGNAPVAMRGMKRAINEFARGELDEEAADRRHRDSMRGAEIKEGIKAFARSAAEVLTPDRRMNAGFPRDDPRIAFARRPCSDKKRQALAGRAPTSPAAAHLRLRRCPLPRCGDESAVGPSPFFRELNAVDRSGLMERAFSCGNLTDAAHFES